MSLDPHWRISNLKTYCLDTSVFIDNPKIIDHLGDSEIIVPFCVLGELDRNRKREGTVGKNAREAIRNIDSLRKKNSKVRLMPSDFDQPTNDLKIIACAEWIQSQENADITLLSNDLGLRVQGEAKGVKTDQFRRSSQEFVYSGMDQIFLFDDLISMLHERDSVKVSISELLDNNGNNITDDNSFYPNQTLIVNALTKKSSTLARVEIEDKNNVVLHKISTNKRPMGVKPACVEQALAVDLLMNKDIDLVSLVGKAGCGKTFLATACGLEQVLEMRNYDRIIILRPIVPMGKDIGYLPGTMEEKLEPWIQPIKDNLYSLFDGNKHTINMLFERGQIVIEAMSYIRGRSIPKSFIIVDECQNLTTNELKTVLTRAADGSKVVLTGDIEQIDNNNIDVYSNGLSRVVEAFKHEDIAGHLTLKKGQRSRLATIAADIL